MMCHVVQYHDTNNVFLSRDIPYRGKVNGKNSPSFKLNYKGFPTNVLPNNILAGTVNIFDNSSP